MNRMTAPKTTFLTESSAPPEVVGPERIREVEERIRENESAREKASGIREEKAGEIAALKTQTPQDITAMIARGRRALLAKIALGLATEADLAKFDRDAAEKQKAIAKQSVPKEAIKILEDTVDGLDDEIRRLDAQGKALVVESHRLWICYLHDCAERDGAIYKEHGEIAFKAMLRVVDYGTIIHSIKKITDVNATNNLGLGLRDFCIPTLGTESTRLPPEKFSSLGVDTNLYSLKSDANLGRFAGDGSESYLIEEFAAMGLKCPVSPAPPVTAPTVKKAHAPEPGEIRSEIMRPPETLRGPDGIPLPTHAIREG